MRRCGLRGADVIRSATRRTLQSRTCVGNASTIVEGKENEIECVFVAININGWMDGWIDQIWKQ